MSGAPDGDVSSTQKEAVELALEFFKNQPNN